MSDALLTARSCLPDRRFHESFEFEHEGLRYTGGVGRYGYGRIGEVFLEAGKVGSDERFASHADAIAVSVLLQHGQSLDVIRSRVPRHSDGSPARPIVALLDLIAGRP